VQTKLAQLIATEDGEGRREILLKLTGVIFTAATAGTDAMDYHPQGKQKGKLAQRDLLFPSLAHTFFFPFWSYSLSHLSRVEEERVKPFSLLSSHFQTSKACETSLPPPKAVSFLSNCNKIIHFNENITCISILSLSNHYFTAIQFLFLFYMLLYCVLVICLSLYKHRTFKAITHGNETVPL